MAAENEYGVQSNTLSLDMTKTYHGVSIMLGDGSIIGRIQDFQATFAERSVSMVYEVNRQTWGRPIDAVPGIESGRSISVTRAEVWDEELEVAMAGASSEYVDLCDQTKPFELIESMFRGSSSYRSWRYRGCWFTSKSLDSWSAEGDGKVNATAAISYVTRQKV